MTGRQDRSGGEGLIPVGVAHVPVPGPIETRDYCFLVLPRFTLLAFSSAIEPLRIANQLSQRPLYRWRVVSEDGHSVTSSCGIAVEAQGGLAPQSRRTSVFVCSGTEAQRAPSRPVLTWLRDHASHGGPYGGICTGAFTLARAGLLAGRRYTTHWENQPGFRELFPDLEPTPRIYELDGPLMTCGGGAAATDMMLAVIAAHHGPAFAARVGEMCLHGAPRIAETPQKTPLAIAIGSRNPRLIAVIRLMQQNLEMPLPLEDLAQAAGCSRRQLERLFMSVLDVPPTRFYRNLRLDLARSLLFETDMSVTEVAIATGFETSNHFGKSFRDRYGVSPREARAV
jgi:AraC family transcriptional regulator, carnitine catabolism transcriptional activator